MRVEDNKAPELLKCAISSMAQICVKKHHNMAFYKPILTKNVDLVEKRLHHLASGV
ncbi:hypothetical protein [Klebsiella pneumoniae IS39]|nr:hypothetical protein [Klebsiella pneumoniae IS39]